jgi:hypothetical protein
LPDYCLDSAGPCGIERGTANYPFYQNML